MAESLGMRIKDSFRQFSFSRPVITEQNCAEYLTNELNNRFKSVLKNGNHVCRINERLITAANLYCSITKNELEVIFNRKFTTVNLDKITIGNLQKFQRLLDCIKNIKNTAELDCSVSKNISDLIELKSSLTNTNKEFKKISDNENLNIEKKTSIITLESYQDDEEGLTAEEGNRIERYLAENRLPVELEGKESEYFINAYQEIKENGDKKHKQLSVAGQTGEEIASETTKLKMELAVDKYPEQNIERIELKPKNEMKNSEATIKETASLSFWQKLSQKTTQFLAISWCFIKNKLSGFLLPSFFSTKIN